MHDERRDALRYGRELAVAIHARIRHRRLPPSRRPLRAEFVSRSQNAATRGSRAADGRVPFRSPLHRNSPGSRVAGRLWGAAATVRGATDQPDAEFHVMQASAGSPSSTARASTSTVTAAADHVHRRTRVRLSMAVRRRGRPAGSSTTSEAACCAISRSRRVPDGRRLLGRARAGQIFIDSMQRVFPDRPHRRARRGPRATARALRSWINARRFRSSAVSAPAPCRTGAASSTTTAD